MLAIDLHRIILIWFLDQIWSLFEPGTKYTTCENKMDIKEKTYALLVTGVIKKN